MGVGGRGRAPSHQNPERRSRSPISSPHARRTESDTATRNSSRSGLTDPQQHACSARPHTCNTHRPPRLRSNRAPAAPAGFPTAPTQHRPRRQGPGHTRAALLCGSCDDRVGLDKHESAARVGQAAGCKDLTPSAGHGRLQAPCQMDPVPSEISERAQRHTLAGLSLRNVAE